MEVKSISREIDSNDRYHQIGNGPTRTKVIASQWFIVLAVNFLAFNVGLFDRLLSEWLLNFANPENYRIYNNSLLYMPFLGIPLFSLIAHCWGSRLTLLLGSALFTTSWLLIFFATNYSALLGGLYIFQITRMSVFTSGITYIAEVTEPHLRSMSIVTTALFRLLGYYFFSYTKYWSQPVIILYLIFPVLGFIGIFMAPESPHWLASKYKFEKAEVSLAWLRGWTTPDNVKSEFSCLKRNQEMPFVCRAFKKSLAVVCCMYIIYILTGTTVIRSFSYMITDFIFRSSLRTDTAWNVIFFVGPIFCIFSVYFLGKRKLIFFSLIVSAVSYLIIAVNIFLKKDGDTAKDNDWIPTIFVLITALVNEMGITQIVHILNSELFPSRYRHLGVGIGRLLELFLSTIFNLRFMDILNRIPINAMFLFFAIICIIAFGIFYYNIPDTDKRTLTEIEEHYKGVTQLNNDTRRNNGIEQGNSSTVH